MVIDGRSGLRRLVVRKPGIMSFSKNYTGVSDWKSRRGRGKDVLCKT
jgi:hypothetical protein